MDFYHRGAGRSLRLFGALIILGGLALGPASLHAQDDSVGAPTAPTDDILEPADPGWDNVNAATAGSDGPVLEIPQAVGLNDNTATTSADPMADAGAATAPDSSVTSGPADSSVASGPADSSVASGPAVAENPSDGLDASASPQPNDDVAALPGVLPGMSRPLVNYHPVGPAINPGWRYVTLPPPTVIAVRPGSLSPLPATSPMLMTPRGAGPVFGGWWHRTR
jgi:hypothetical protein